MAETVKGARMIPHFCCLEFTTNKLLPLPLVCADTASVYSEYFGFDAKSQKMCALLSHRMKQSM